jgi:hypothetical protein
VSSRRIPVVCVGRLLRDGEYEHDAIEVGAFVSTVREGVEWWTADDRADRTVTIEDTPGNRARPDNALAAARATDRFVIRCSRPDCRQNYQSGDTFGIGYRPVENVRERTSVLRSRKPHDALSRAADTPGLSCLPLSLLAGMLKRL